MEKITIVFSRECNNPKNVNYRGGDQRTPISETEQFYQALKLRKIDSIMIRVPGSSHGIAGRPSRLNAKVDNILAWFDRYRLID
ncbi:MAG: hypothetical protein CM1200mP10_08750 [Candidatus Neomarinimicrobiota bacterium]|nr:MAG: hypothetical protein CM1200mP10_08750 [Candidatus Neomarinimicrobiota bacterium]